MDGWENKPAEALRMLIEPHLEERGADGRYVSRKRLQRDLLHELMRNPVSVPVERTTPHPRICAEIAPPVGAQRTARAVCAALILAGIAVAVVAPRIDSAGLALAAAPFGKLIGAIFGRAS